MTSQFHGEHSMVSSFQIVNSLAMLSSPAYLVKLSCCCTHISKLPVCLHMYVRTYVLVCMHVYTIYYTRMYVRMYPSQPLLAQQATSCYGGLCTPWPSSNSNMAATTS